MGLKGKRLTFRSIERRLEDLKDLEYVSKDHISLYKELIKVQFEEKNSLDKEEIFPSINKRSANKRIEKGLPLVTLNEVKLQKGHLKSLFDKICQVILNHDGKEKEIMRLVEAEKDNRLNLKDLIRYTVSFDLEYFNLLSEKVGIPKNTILFIAVNLTRPFFELIASRLKGKVRDDLWLRGFCPVCGREPFMAALRREEGKRILQCALCGMTWSFNRLKCPFCNNEEQRSLRFFFVEDESPYRIDVCDRCKRYIKTVDERKLSEDKDVILSIEDIATIYLDILAEKEGYTSGSTRILN
ncbi:MAG: formate dehydrogenase accessory protein FdhE [bacterium]|nr:formate dehydrogenase accessory protein FdhE [bacterium]